MTQSPFDARAWMLPGLVAATCVALALFDPYVDPSWRAALAYTREGLAAGELWTLVSAHLVHVDRGHAALDVVAFVLVAWTFSRDLDRWTTQAFVLACGLVAVDVALWFLHPEVARYAGLSGLVHAWFAAGAMTWALRARERPVDRARVAWGVALLAGLALKLYLETRGVAFWRTGLEAPVVTAAHRWGAAGGLVAATASAWWTRRRRA